MVWICLDGHGFRSGTAATLSGVTVPVLSRIEAGIGIRRVCIVAHDEAEIAGTWASRFVRAFIRARIRRQDRCHRLSGGVCGKRASVSRGRSTVGRARVGMRMRMRMGMGMRMGLRWRLVADMRCYGSRKVDRVRVGEDFWGVLVQRRRHRRPARGNGTCLDHI